MSGAHLRLNGERTLDICQTRLILAYEMMNKRGSIKDFYELFRRKGRVDFQPVLKHGNKQLHALLSREGADIFPDSVRATEIGSRDNLIPFFTWRTCGVLRSKLL